MRSTELIIENNAQARTAHYIVSQVGHEVRTQIWETVWEDNHNQLVIQIKFPLIDGIVANL